ncbi:hypothetical protein [Nostoc sp. CHAB 5836]|nr:hypothetical protein [Nostoc sp. CHAB 5836]
MQSAIGLYPTYQAMSTTGYAYAPHKTVPIALLIQPASSSDRTF